MKKINKGIFALLAIGSAAFANEEFGGVGLSVLNTSNGLSISEVIPGTPAAASNLKAGDFIIAVDNVSLEGKTLDESKELLRGIVNKPIEITYMNEDGVNTATLRRVQMFVVEGENQKVAMDGKELVAVLDNGKKGVYLSAKEAKPVEMKKQVKTGDAISFKEISRNEISFTSSEKSSAIIEISNIDGKQIAQLSMKQTVVGNNILKWDGSKIPNGQYIVSITQAGKSYSKSIIFK